MDSPHENLGAMPSTQDQFQAVGLDFDQLGMFSDLISGQSNSAVDFQHQIDSGMASPSSSISGGVPLSAEVEDNAAIPPGPAEAAGEPEATVPSKIGSRFTSGAIKVLRTWFERHEKHPYPTPKDVDRLQNQTGLERQQITNWFANTRRRKKFRPQGTSSAQIPSWTETTTGPIEIPTRRPTPMPFEMMNPMQRWEHSPPEHEPALASDINRAVAASTGQSSFPSRARSPGRRRRRALTKMQKGERIKLVQARNTYQCTFCTETFKTKYDWQRHEKSLHLSLEEWVCSPHGSTENHPEKGEVCAYCEEPSPNKPHLDEHHQSACSEKPVEDRTFYRKDHLRQHLKLVHGSNQMTRLMDKWKVVKNNIRSACGFCGAKLETWAERGDHLADHFKNGSTMTDWQGDWGFEPAVMEMLDNAMPPYLIRFESFSALPFTASVGPADTAPSAYELLKLEIEYYIRNYFEGKDSSPSDDELKYEGCSIIFGAEFFSSALGSSPPSWLRDIFMCSTEIATKARFRPMQQLAKLRLSQLRINGKMNIFEECQLESELRHYIGMHVTLGLALSDHEIQREACAILARVEESSTNPSRRYRRLAKELSRFVASTMSPNNPNSHIPTDEEIRHQARWVLYDDDDPWNQTPADVEEWLLKFKKDVGLA
ncbi:Homeobox protein 4 [Colletotrichum siamense]|uniref:Homeobox protein 4 n=1 Tax=Colletotrichum siamense TaxID=690259 RepID=A0A9P5EEG6_COLSI|nr:Homeobox protein 4 [Colletotrichum siamense]KAF4849988.1 Homeobox protein 4 [Colletotrichum siamense]